MLENNEEQLQELEEKLESLTQRLEDLELNPSSFDPFDQYDVERMLEDFRTKEQGLESQVEESEELEESVGDDFIQVSTNNTKSPKFEVHWISIEECGNYTDCSEIVSVEEAKDAFIQAIASRADPAGSKRKVKHGDVLILLCRNTGDLPESASEGDEPLKKSCTYIGMYSEYSSRQAPEPNATEVVEAKISDSNDFGDVFVWSSCSDCENLGNEVDILTVSDSGSGSSSSSNFTFLKSGNDATSYGSDVLDYVTDLEIVQDNLGSNTRGLVIDSTVTDVAAGYHGSLKKLSASLSNWYVDFSKKKFKVKSDVGSITTGTFNFGSSGNFLVNKPLLSDECGNLRVSIYTSSSTIDLFSGSLSNTSDNFSNFAKNISVSLGSLEVVDTSEVTGNIGIEAEITTVSKFEAEGTDAKQIFFPAISSTDAGNILASDVISYLENYELTIEAKYTVVYESEGKGDADYYFYKKEKKVNDAAFASGLFVDGSTVSEDTTKVLIGIIRVRDIPLKYSCDPIYGCTPDPAGQYDDESCGGNCTYGTYDPAGGDGTGSIWLWDAGYNGLGAEDWSDLSDINNNDEYKQGIESRTDLVYNGLRFELVGPHTGQYEFEYWTNDNGLRTYTGGNIGLFEGTMPFHSMLSDGSYLRRVTPSRPKGVSSSISTRNIITGEFINEEEIIVFNF